MDRAIERVELPRGVNIPFVEQGDPSGVPVVMLHGFAESWRAFERVLPHLPASLHAFALTQRGHGDASRPESGYGLPEFARDVDALLDARGIEKAVLVGHSMGSAVATRFALDHAERTSGLVLSGASPTLKGPEGAQEFWKSTVAELDDPVDPGFVRRVVRSSFSERAPDDVLESAERDARKVPAFVWKAALRARFEGDGEFAGELDRIEAPTRILWGDRDARYARSDEDTIVSAIPRSRLVVFPGTGHGVPQEEPERYAAELADFVDSLAA